jgi:hypothetical protein
MSKRLMIKKTSIKPKPDSGINHGVSQSYTEFHREKRHGFKITPWYSVVFTLCFLLLPCLSLSALDFGIFLNQNAGYEGVPRGENFDYSIGAVARFSGLIGETGDFIVTAAIEANYNDGWGFVPELLRTELAFRPGQWAFEIGRMNHSDPLGFVAEGLFDGVKAAYYSEAGTFSAGAWYLGLLYKKKGQNRNDRRNR